MGRGEVGRDFRFFFFFFGQKVKFNKITYNFLVYFVIEISGVCVCHICGPIPKQAQVQLWP